jgi:hypothetical protein
MHQQQNRPRAAESPRHGRPMTARHSESECVIHPSPVGYETEVSIGGLGTPRGHESRLSVSAALVSECLSVSAALVSECSACQ